MAYEFFGEKIIFPSGPVPGINNDQSLSSLTVQKYFIFENSSSFLHFMLDQTGVLFWVTR